MVFASALWWCLLLKVELLTGSPPLERVLRPIIYYSFDAFLVSERASKGRCPKCNPKSRLPGDRWCLQAQLEISAGGLVVFANLTLEPLLELVKGSKLL